MYLDYWRLKERPFEVGPDARFFYSSPNHEEGLQRLLFCTHEARGSMVLTGEYGCGKSLLCRVLIRELARDARSQLALIINPRLQPKEFLESICFELGGSRERGSLDKVALLDQIVQILQNNAKADRETTLVIDEAQAIESQEVLEEIRLLMNIQSEDKLLLNIIFVGQPALKEKVLKLKQLSQRIQLWFHLPPLDEENTRKYIEHRLHVAGVDGEIFTPEACQKVFHLTGGIPRLINNLCNMALWIGEKGQLRTINPETVETASQTLKGG
ncbi:MAG: AAA family ATPase [Deltaproteobacteria bacterium]|nr:AAA family ATPase [Deltaproteobacteria bacterium]